MTTTMLLLLLLQVALPTMTAHSTDSFTTSSRRRLLHAVVEPTQRSRSRLEETERTASCDSILSMGYTSDFQEQMDPCSCRELVDGRYRVECKYDYCEHCVGSTCGIQETVHIYDATGEEETTFLCVSYTSGAQEGTEVCFSFGTSALDEQQEQQPTSDVPSSNLFCSVEIDGKSCSTCQYHTCSNGLTQPRMECGDETSPAPIDLCNATEIMTDSPLAMLRTDFTFASCFFDVGGEQINKAETIPPNEAPSQSPATQRSAASEVPIVEGTESPSLVPVRTSPTQTILSYSPRPTTARFAQFNEMLRPTVNTTASTPEDNGTTVPATSSPTAIQLRSRGNTPSLVPATLDLDSDDNLFSNTQIENPDDSGNPTTSSASRLLAATLSSVVPVALLLLP